MNRLGLLGMLVVGVLMNAGCQKEVIRTSLEASAIPDHRYDVTVYDGPMRGSYAVLFEIPNDDKRVSMRYGSFTEKVGLDSPGDYIDELRARTKGHRAVRIGEQDGTVRAYLLVSNLLNYRIQTAVESIVVTIEDPYFGYLHSGR